jgi:hypothetical protein
MSPNAALSVLLCLAVTAANPIVCPNLKSAGKFAVVAYSGVTNTGPSVIKGNLAVYPISSVTGFPPGAITGDTQLATAAAAQAQTDQTSAYNYCKSIPSTLDLTGIDLAGQILAPGVYKFASTAAISAGGILTFKGAGIYIIQVGSAITTGAGSQMVVEDGAKPGCIFWQEGSSATLGATSTFLGNILAYASVTFGSDVTYKGAVYAQTGDVTLIDDTITHARCNFC